MRDRSARGARSSRVRFDRRDPNRLARRGVIAEPRHDGRCAGDDRLRWQVAPYLVFRPASLDAAKQVPLVLALHGYTQSATALEGWTRLNDLATSGGFEVVYPQGYQNSWNAGICCGQAQAEKLDDVGFIKALIDHLISLGGIDPKRVFATGLSNGALMSYRLACELSGSIAGIASVSGTMGVSESSCHPDLPVSVLEMHGTADDLVPYDGGDTGFGYFPASKVVIAEWAGNDHCTGNGTTTSSGVVTTQLWSTCRGGTIVRLDVIAGGAHTWFGSVPGEPNSTQVVWDFFNHLQVRA